MAEQQTKTKQAEKPEAASQDGGNGSNGGGHKTALRAVALAAASGATAIAARKAFSSGRQGSGSGQESKNRGSGGGDDSLVTSMITSGWDAARDSLLPLAENAATSAGEFLAQSGPELVRETLVPRFIEGFERGRDAGSSEDGG
jgi:hypothetical protein